jgi:hypothetical protein
MANKTPMTVYLTERQDQYLGLLSRKNDTKPQEELRRILDAEINRQPPALGAGRVLAK